MPKSTTIVHMIGQLSHGGSERQLVLVTNELKARGWKQAVVTLHPGDAWETTLRANGIPLLQLPANSSKLVRLAKLWRLVAGCGGTLLHSWSWHTNVYAAWMRPRGIQHRILSIRGNPLVDRGTGDRLTKVPHRYVYRMADHVITNSAACVEELRGAGVQLPDVSIVSNIVHLGPMANPSAVREPVRLVAVGNLDALKGYDILLKGLKPLKDEGIRFQLEIAGEGTDRSRLVELRDSLGLSEQVTFLGTVDRVPNLLSEANIAVHSSFSEGLSNAVLEAMGAGLPVVATSVGDVPRFVEDGRTGLLVPPRETAPMTVALRRLIQDPEARVRMGAAGRQTVVERCNPKAVAEEYEAVYMRLLGSTRSDSRGLAR